MLNCRVPFLVVKYKPLCAKLERSLAAKLTCKGLSRATCIFEKNTTYIDEVMTSVSGKTAFFSNHSVLRERTVPFRFYGLDSIPRSFTL